MSPLPRPVTPAILGAFYLVASLICTTAGASLLSPGALSDRIWAIKPNAHHQLLALAPWSGLGFLGLAVVMASTSVGCLQRKIWGWKLAVAIFALNAVGDAGRAVAGDILEGLIGVIAAGLILFALTRPKIRAAFRK